MPLARQELEFTMRVRAVRGATTLGADNPEEMAIAVVELIEAVVSSNRLAPEEIISILFTSTPDLISQFPATAARARNPELLANIPLICAAEVSVPGSLPLTIRVLIHAHTELSQAEIKHQYLRGASVLRPDISK